MHDVLPLFFALSAKSYYDNRKRSYRTIEIRKLQMIKWKHLFNDYYLGIFLLGIAAILIQELPYIIMPFIELKSNPIMEMKEYSAILNIFEKIFGIFSMVLLVLVVKENDKWFSVKEITEKVFFFIAVALLAVNLITWVFYFNGVQSKPLIIICLFAAVPLYYLFIGLWRKNYLLAISSTLFFIIHTLHGCLNLLT